MLDDSDLPVLLTLIVACAIWTRPAVLDIVGFAAMSAAIGSCARIASVGVETVIELARTMARSVRS